MKMILPPRLDKHKSIGVIAPADPVAGVCPTSTIKRGYDYLRQHGFSIVEGDSVKALTKKHTAGSVSVRVNDIHEFTRRADIGCIMAFWGGFNTNQLLDSLDYDSIKSNPKIFIGYSDVAALTTAITTKTGLVTFCGPGVISFAKPEPFDYTWEYFERMCVYPQGELLVKDSPEYADDLYFLRDDNDHRIKKHNDGTKTLVSGKARGEVLAGNLQTLLVLNGTKYLPDMKGKVVFIEEDETTTPPLLDRFLIQCRQIGWFEKIAGLVFGRFTEHSRFSREDSLKDLLASYFPHARFPVLYNVDFGHSDPLITIPNGGMVALDGGKKQIIFEQSVK